MSLLDLPVDLWRDLIGPALPLSSLVSLSATCKTLCTIARQIPPSEPLKLPSSASDLTKIAAEGGVGQIKKHWPLVETHMKVMIEGENSTALREAVRAAWEQVGRLDTFTMLDILLESADGYVQL